MLAYDKVKLDTWFNRRMTEEAADLGLISETEKQSILNRLPAPFFNPRTIVRIGLGFATMTAVSMFYSFIQLVIGMGSGDFIISFVIGAGVIVLLEHMIRKKGHFRSGIDDMLLYMGYGIIMGGIISMFDKVPDPSIILSGSASMLAVMATLRYADRLMAGLGIIAIILFIYFTLIRIDYALWILLPCIGIVVSLAGWFLTSKYLHKAMVLYYRHCLEFIQLLSLIILGVSTNYFIAATWFADHQETLRGFWKIFFIGAAIVTPIITIVTGLLSKDKIRIRIGALMVAGAIVTYHHYFSNMPVEIGCLFYGSLLLVFSYWLLKHHKARKNGISFAEKQDGRELFEMESLLVGAGVSMIIPQAAPNRYGGGDFGGAGSGGKY